MFSLPRIQTGGTASAFPETLSRVSDALRIRASSSSSVLKWSRGSRTALSMATGRPRCPAAQHDGAEDELAELVPCTRKAVCLVGEADRYANSAIA